MRGEGGARTGRRAWALAALLVVVACDAPKPTPAPDPTPGPSQAALATPGPDGSPTPTATPVEPSALDRITRAVASGQLDEATGYLYRLYAQWGDPRLPTAFQGPRVNDHVLAATAETAYWAMSPEQQAIMLPVAVRPTHDSSYWTTLPPEATAVRSGIQLAAALAPDPRCGEDGWSRYDLPQIPVTVWARCAVDAGGDYQLHMAGDADTVALSMTALWGPMTRLMGTPIPDDFAAPLGLFEVEEAGDGRLDIYLVNGSNQSYGRPLAIRQAAPAMAPSAPEYRGTASSGYIVMDVLRNRKPHELESTLAHEFFHVLQFRHEMRGLQTCPYPSVAAASTCRAADRSLHWFVEASASWAEHEFVPAGRPVAAYERFGRFLGTDRSLAHTDGENEYLSFMWPLFMEQEHPQGPESIAATWRAIEGKSGWAAVQAAVDSQVSFEANFRDFAVRLWNEKLLPGDPIQPRFNDPGLDRDFPTTTPEQADPHLRYVDDIQLVLDELHREQVEISELSAKYYKVALPPGAGRLTLTFSGLIPNAKLDVDALVEIHPEGWSRRELDPATTEWCLDKPGEAVEDAILVLSNHSQTPDEHITGEWSVLAEPGGCQQVGDGLAFTSVRESGLPSDDVFTTTTETLTLRMSLKSSSTGFGFEDDGGSTYHATVDSNGTIKGLPGCDTVTEAHGAGSGPLPDPRAIQVSVSNGVMSVAASFPVRVQSSMTSCGGSSESVSEYTVQLPPCDGLEIPGAVGVLTYQFACVGSTPGWSWRLSGTVRLRI